jgi:hypothetical protein
MNIQKIVLTVLGLIALFLILSNGKAFNDALKTSGQTINTGVAILQGRSAKQAGLA